MIIIGTTGLRQKGGIDDTNSLLSDTSFSTSGNRSHMLPAVDTSEILKTLNSTLDESRATDPSAIDISAQMEEKIIEGSEGLIPPSDENSSSSTNSLPPLQLPLPLNSPSPLMQSTPMHSGKVFKRRNTAMSQNDQAS